MNVLTREEMQESDFYPYPVILTDAGFNIIYKNSAAVKSAGLKLRLGTNMKKYMDLADFDKLCGANEKKEFRILKLNTASTLKRFAFHPGSETVKAVIFYDALNFIKENDPNEGGIIKSIEKIIYQYYIKEMQVKTHISPVRNADFYGRDYKKISRITEHFVKHMANLPPHGEGKYKNYCDIAAFLNKFAPSISQYVSSFGYKVNFHIEDKMFFYMLNENDFLLINFIMSAFAFKYTVFNKVDISFRSDYYAGISGILRYEFTTGKNFIRTHKDIFVSDYLSEINDIEYLDLNLAALIAKNNGLKLRVYYGEDDDNRIFMDLIFREIKIPCAESPPLDLGKYGNYITPDEIKKQAEIQFAGVFDG